MCPDSSAVRRGPRKWDPDRVHRAGVPYAGGSPALRAVNVSVQGCRTVLRGRGPSSPIQQTEQAVRLGVLGLERLCTDVQLIPPTAGAAG
jgi:hypothetical protein